MVLFVWISWIKFAPTQLTKILAITMKAIVQNILKQSSGFWNYAECSLQLILIKNVLQCAHKANLMNTAKCFVGVILDVNCNQLNSCDIVAKKNTRISRPSVSAVCSDTIGPVVIPNVAHCKNTCNSFAVLHV